MTSDLESRVATRLQQLLGASVISTSWRLVAGDILRVIDGDQYGPKHEGEYADECPTCAPNQPRVGGRYEATLAGRVEAIRDDGFVTIKWDGCEGAASALSPTEVAAATWVELTPPDYPDGWYGWTSPPGYEQVLLRRDREWIWPLTGAVQAVGSGDVFRRLPS